MTRFFTVESGSAKLAGEVTGAGAGVVFLHAGVADRRMWRAQLTTLGDRYLAAAYDRRGFGETTCADEAFSHVEDLVAVLDHLGLESTTLVGCSQGGRVALDLALAAPQRVQGLVLVAPAVSGAPPPDAISPEIEELLEKLEQAEEANDLARVNATEAHLWLDGPTSPEGRVGGAVRDLFLDMNARALQAPELTQEREPPSAFARLAEVSAPMLVLWGDLDFPHVQARCYHLAQRIPNAQPKELPGTAHLPNLEQAEVFNAALLDFMRRA